MISKKIADFASTISFTAKDDSAFGFINDFLISVYETGSKKCFFVYYYLDTDIPDTDGNPISIMTVSGTLMETFAKYEISEYHHTENGLEVYCNLPYRDLYSLMKETTNKLSNVVAIKKNICVQCNKIITEKDLRFRISKAKINHIICESCSKAFVDDESDKSDDVNSHQNPDINIPNTEKTSTLKGILGALAFALGVAICFVLLYAYAIPLPSNVSSFKPGYYVNWISSFMALASFLGYKIFSKESVGNKSILISGAVSIFTVLIAQYISSVLLFARESVFVFENLSQDKICKMLPYLLKVPFTDSFTSPDFKIYVLMDLIFIIISLLVISFLLTPKTESKTVIEEL